LIDASDISAVSIFKSTFQCGETCLEQQETGQGWNAMNRGIE
jgi:hypothetical protein